MNARAYNLDATAAKQADGGNYITETGKYVGVFTRAEAVTSRQNTDGIEFTFKTDSGASADFLSLWTYNAEGKQLPSFKTLNAIMTCLRVKSIEPTQGKVEKYDQDSRQRVPMTATVFSALQNKSIGLLLQKVHYFKTNGDAAYKFEIAGVFDADSELTASEILDKATQPEKLARMVANLKDKHEGQRTTSAPASAPAGSFADFDSDIPF